MLCLLFRMQKPRQELMSFSQMDLIFIRNVFCHSFCRQSNFRELFFFLSEKQKNFHEYSDHTHRGIDGRKIGLQKILLINRKNLESIVKWYQWPILFEWSIIISFLFSYVMFFFFIATNIMRRKKNMTKQTSVKHCLRHNIFE